MLVVYATVLMWAVIALDAWRQSRASMLLARAAPFVVCAVNWWALRAYHVDDAGISYAYARNLAEGLGLRPLALAPPVEGFSNPAWTLLLASAELLGLHAHLASKMFQLILGLATLMLTRRVLHAVGKPETNANCAAGLVATNASFVIWANAGLENALLAIALIGTIAAAVLPRMRSTSFMLAVCSGVVVLARPEGPALAVASLLSYALITGLKRRREFEIAAAVAASTLAIYEAFRIAYFSDWLPNTYYAKLGDPLDVRVFMGIDYVRAAFLNLGPAFVIGGCLGCFIERKLRRLALGALLSITAGVIFAVCSGGDWMSQGRFLSHLVPLFALMAAPGLMNVVSSVAKLAPSLRRAVPVLVIVALAVRSVAQSLALHSIVESTLSLQSIAELGELYRSLGPAACGETEPYVATPDIGGVLYLSNRIRVMDLAALVDRDASRRHFEPGYWRARLDDQPRPQLVFVHGDWTAVTGLSEPVMAAAGYRPLCPAPIPLRPTDQSDLDRRFPPQLYGRADCRAVVSAAAQQRLRSLCEKGIPGRTVQASIVNSNL